MNLNYLLDFLSRRSRTVPGLIAFLTVVMLLLTLTPADNYLPSSVWDYDKAGHLLMFGSWSFLLGLQRYLAIGAHPNYLLIFLVGTGFGLTIEILQYLLPLKRQANFWDVVFDAIGCLLAIALLYLLISRHIKTTR